MKAIVTGISGQDGYFLSQLFLSKGIRDSRYSETKQFNDSRTIALLPENIRNQIIIHYDDITDGNLLSDLLQRET